MRKSDLAKLQRPGADDRGTIAGTIGGTIAGTIGGTIAGTIGGTIAGTIGGTIAEAPDSEEKPALLRSLD
jgi:fructose-specific phosphotransferase system IIC component